MLDSFRWNEWNLDHATKHGVSVSEAEACVLAARKPYPLKIDDQKYLVVGRGAGNRWIQVIFVRDPEGPAYIIHARPLNDRDKRRARRRS